MLVSNRLSNHDHNVRAWTVNGGEDGESGGRGNEGLEKMSAFDELTQKYAKLVIEVQELRGELQVERENRGEYNLWERRGREEGEGEGCYVRVCYVR